jgi:hypothetical protein
LKLARYENLNPRLVSAPAEALPERARGAV